MRSFGLLSVAALAGLAAAQSPVWGQCGGTGYTGPKTCVSGSKCVFSNEWYSQCQPSGSSPPPSSPPPSSPPPSNPPPSSPPPSSPPPSGGIKYPTAVVKSLPNAVGTVSTNKAIAVSGTFDGGMKRYERNPGVCQGQTETGEADAMFILSAGATLANVIIGASQAEGVHCKGTCTLVNVWWADVCEDAATFKQTSGTSQIIGGGAFKASDKIFQFNGRGTVSIKYFYANDYGKLVRSCGNCSGNGGPRNVVVDNSVLINGGVACGINTNYGDTCRLSNVCANKGKFCDMYTGNSNGDEPKKISSGPNGSTCIASGTSTNC